MKFDGVLIATDLDGTLAIGKEINKKNIDAIEYFKANGGKFTICTGRIYKYLDDIIKICAPNTYLISLNGAIIVNPVTEEFIYRGYLPEGYIAMYNTLFKYSYDLNDVYVYYKDCDNSTGYRAEDLISGEKHIDTDRAIHKIVFCFKTESIAKAAEEEANALCLPDLDCTRSWPTGVEILHKGSTKGVATQRLKEIIGAKTLICAGDFENDIPMISGADIGYAVGNAIDSVKAAADKVTASVSDGALAAIIQELDILL